MSTSAASVPTVCASLCQPIHLAYDGTSFLQVVLCYQLHFSSPGKKDALCPPHTHTKCTHTHTAAAEGQTPAECLSPLLLASATARHCGRDGHLLSARLDWKGASGRGASCCSFLLAWAVWSVVLLRCLCCSHSYRRFLGKKTNNKFSHGGTAKLNFAFNKHEMQLWSRCYAVKSNCSAFSRAPTHFCFKKSNVC